MSAAGPPQGRLREQGEAKARRARLRARAAADPNPQRETRNSAEAARNCFPCRSTSTAEEVDQ